MREVLPLQCEWNGQALLVTRITDQFGRSWAEHAYPGRDTSEWEDLGRRSARFQVEALFNGPDWFRQLAQFREAVDWDGAGKFRHPYFGTHDGIIQEWTVTHLDRKEDFAEVRFTFIEGAQAPFSFSTSDTLSSAAAAATAASTAARSSATALPT